MLVLYVNDFPTIKRVCEVCDLDFSLDNSSALPGYKFVFTSANKKHIRRIIFSNDEIRRLKSIHSIELCILQKLHNDRKLFDTYSKVKIIGDCLFDLKSMPVKEKENGHMDSLSSLAYGYAIHDATATLQEYNKMYHHKPQDPIKKVIFNDPATIVYWADGSKTVVKAEGEKFDPEKGLAMAIAKKSLGNQGNYYDIFRKWLPKENLKGE